MKLAPVSRATFLRTKVLGIRDLQAEVARTAEELRTAERPAEMAAGEPIRDKWKALVPFHEGHYRDSLAVAWLGKLGAAGGTAWVPGLPRDEQPLIYAKRLEYGDSEIRAQPSARPALAAARAEAVEAGADEFRTVIRRRKARRRPTR